MGIRAARSSWTGWGGACREKGEVGEMERREGKEENGRHTWVEWRKSNVEYET